MDNNVGFFVFVVESPSDVDFYHGRSEGYLLAQAAGLDEIPCVVRTAINKAAFIAALRLGITEAMATYPDRLPILHISAHGATSGIQLSSGDVVPWQALRGLLTQINKTLDGLLVLCTSACEGYSACQMAMQSGDILYTCGVLILRPSASWTLRRRSSMCPKLTVL